MRKNIEGFNGVALVMGLFAVCCGGPLLIGALAATGLGAWVLGSGGPVGPGLGLIAVAAAALWVRRSRWSSSPWAPDRAASTATRPEVKS